MDFDDFDDDFGDDFSDNGNDFMDDSDDDFGSEDSLDDDSEIENEPTGDDICDDEITVEDAVFIGGTMMGWAYEEGVEEGKRRKLEREFNKNDDDK